MPTDTFNANGTWTCPTGITVAVVTTTGTGAAGSSTSLGGGGGGGACAQKTITTVPAANTAVVVSPAAGADAIFGSNVVLAKGGGAASLLVAGTGGSSASCVGDVKFSGGNGSAGNGVNAVGGGGGSASATAGGGNASGSTGGTGQASGGNGSLAGNGSSGSAPGGGGGSGLLSPGLGGTGQVTVTYGDLCTALNYNISNRVAGKTAGNTTQQLWSSGTTWNTSLFCSDINLTCLPYSNTYSGANCGGCLIQGNVILTAAHIRQSSWIGTIFTFAKTDASTVTATVTAYQQISNTDIMVLLLDKDLSSLGITPAKIMPTNYSTYLSNSNSTFKPTYVVYRNQFSLLSVGILQYLGPVIYGSDAVTASWFTQVIGGDSGNAAGVIYNGEFIAVTSWYTAISGPDWGGYGSIIASTITSLGG